MSFTKATAPTPPGIIVPLGDSFPQTSIHSLVSPPNNVETGSNNDPRTGTGSALGVATPAAVSSVVPSSSSASASPTSVDTVPSSFPSQATPITDDGESHPLPPAAIVGILLLVITLLGLIIFFTRRHFVLQRASKTTPARSRASKLVISTPTDFQHVATADRSVNSWNKPMGPSSSSSPSFMNVGGVRKEEEPCATTESPYGRDTKKYTVNFGALESGLHDHVQTMQFARNPSS